MSGDKWRVYSCERAGIVGIQPPREIDREFDDLELRITCNMIGVDIVRIAKLICDKLNS